MRLLHHPSLHLSHDGRHLRRPLLASSLYSKPFIRATEKLELPSISQVHTRGPADIPWYNPHAAERPLLPGDKLPALSLPTATQGLSRTAYPDPSVTNSTNSSARTSLSSASVPVNEPRSPPSSADLSGTQGRLSLDSSAPTEYSLPPSVNEGYYPSPTSLGSMNQTQPYMDVHSHMSSAQSYAPQGATAGAMSQYQYHGQPPVMQPASSYAPAAYPQYGYPTGVTSPPTGHPPSSMGGQMPAQLLPLPGKLQSQNVIEDYSDRYQVSNHAVAPPSGYGNSTGAPLQGFVFDGTGQVAPPGAKPRVTATLWEDEGSLCYQVEAKGVCVARREDNHMINGTKLLNVAGMTRGRRDGILKSEKLRHVVKIGPMHLKGVWIPFERALEFANKEKITDLLYPLFVHNIGGLLYHPANQTRTNMVVQESQQRRLEGPPPGPPAHATPMSSHMSQGPMNGQPGSRPGLERANTFPTPPASASSMMNQGSSYEWGGQVPHTQPLSIDTALSNQRSMPTTPATTPPGNNMQGLPAYQGQGYDSSKPYYSAAPQTHAQYAPHTPLTQSGMPSYGQPLAGGYMKSEMAPPNPRPGVSEPETSERDSNRYSQSNGPGETVAEHDQEYMQDHNAGYNSNRGSYTYTTNPSVSSLTGEHSQLTPEMTSSPSQQNGSGRMTPRTGAGPPSSLGFGRHSRYPGQRKRMREDDDIRAESTAEYETSKRRKTITDATLGGPVGGPPILQPMKPSGVMARHR
ncbi:hypothetical protein N7489_009464 [Penicillium chrysogenum]|uniref:uncharacterized protein n=1 Tax=Penicillium chrysogenum TaxID=5076 RepID=UPI0024DF13D0|nr:uncharacterized protein N7489_009464 [Penicillium chrysogenum]KAJ5228756.1 hypothetical protein N7489_009464 [Penicillium chrysogenum]